MVRSHSGSPLSGMMTLALIVLAAGSAAAADTPRVVELRTQKAGTTTYFHIRLDPPADMRVPGIESLTTSERDRRKMARLPQLVPQDGKTWAVYPRLVISNELPYVGFEGEPRPPVPVKGLEFAGKLRAGGRAKFLLLYPTRAEYDPEKTLLLDKTPDKDNSPCWMEVALEVDLDSAAAAVLPDPAGKRLPHRAPTRDDLEGLWAEAQAARLAVLEFLAPDFGFYSFARAATGRKYGVQALPLLREKKTDREQSVRQLYEITTGTAAITQSLQMKRLLEPKYFETGRRVVDIKDVPGIDIAEHPWKEMMIGKIPAPEPLARLVPHDNFYVHFKSIRKFLEFGELLDQWGTSASRAYEMNSRDVAVKQRYERQLCLRGGGMGKAFGPLVVKSLALTGSDGYLREGTDLAVIFHVTSPKLFLAAVAPFLQQARQEFGGQLKESKSDSDGVTVESFVTPLREVSLHRAVVGEFVVYANSRVGLRRILEAHHGRRKTLDDSLDFRYMRTAFRLDDDQEDGFAFLSDAFIRQLVGPAGKIKEKRRLEALTSLTLATHAALFSAWETGKLPDSHAALLAASSLRSEEILTPEREGITWQPDRQTALSNTYNTLHFPTPLIELPIDKITRAEEQEYLEFRSEYVKLWRQYFDPVGMRFALNDRRVTVETYILPLAGNRDYDNLREITGGGTTNLDPASFSADTLLQGRMHISPLVKNEVERLFGQKIGLGDWATVRLDDSSRFTQLAELEVKRNIEPKFTGFQPESILSRQFPLTFGVHVQDKKTFADMFKIMESKNYLDTSSVKYKNVSIQQCNEKPKEKWSLPSIHHVFIDDAWYVSFRDKPLKELIDRSAAQRQGKAAPKKEELVPVNLSLYASPAAAKKARPALHYYLEWETHRRAVANGPIWYALQRGGLLADSASAQEQQALARRFLNFVPVSPDEAPYVYDARTDDVRNRRHGSYRIPERHRGLADDSPLLRILEEFPSVRADLRFREDGLHTVLTVERKGKEGKNGPP